MTTILEIINWYNNNYKTMFSMEPWKEWYENNNQLLIDYGITSTLLYSLDYDGIINTGFRTNRLSEIGFIVANQLINVINKSQPIPTPLVLFRGVKPTLEFSPNQLSINDTITEPGFLSKSVNPMIAKRFAGGRSCCLELIEYPDNIKMILLSTGPNFDISNMIGEYEMLTFPGEYLQVTNINLSKNRDYPNQVVFQLNKFVYSQLPNDIISFIDISIDAKYQIIIQQILSYLDKYKMLGFVKIRESNIPSMDYIINRPIDVEIIDFLRRHIKFGINLTMSASAIIMYLAYIFHNDVKIFGLTNILILLGYLQSNNHHKYLSDGIEVTDIRKVINDVFSGHTIQVIDEFNNVLNTCTSEYLPIDFNMSNQKVSLQTNQTKYILEQYESFLQYDVDIQYALAKLYGNIPIIMNIIGYTEPHIKLQHWILDVQKFPIMELARNIGMIIPPNTINPRRYYLRNLHKYIFVK